MVQDPVTGNVNTNPKQLKSKKKSNKVSRSDTLHDLRPLVQFESKFIGKNRLSVCLIRAGG
jgi:hypothetical protein